jgi:NAD(P)-dependent dehydrogenase (short-subunit alcohol dehydrogenase family)
MAALHFPNRLASSPWLSAPLLALPAPQQALLLLALALALLLARLARLTARYEAREAALMRANLEALGAAARAARAGGAPPLTALVTGANSGIGLALCEQLAARGVRVALACRSPARGAAALARVRDAAAGTDGAALAHFVLELDVSDPASVLRAARALRAGGSNGVAHLDFLVLNAGIMAVASRRWSVIAHALCAGRLRYFMATSRAHAGGPSFLAAPVDEVGACGAPLHFATHVLGHLLLAEELLPLMGALDGSGSGDGGGGGGARVGRILWTNSSSSCVPPQAQAAQLLEPPARLGAPSGFQQMIASDAVPPVDLYGQAKYAQELVSAALARRVPQLSATICPGFVATDLTPPFFNFYLPLLRRVRVLVPFMVLTCERGCAPLVALMASPEPRSVPPEAKWALRCDSIAPAVAGAPPLPHDEQERMWARAQQWLRVWRASVDGGDGAGGGAMAKAAALVAAPATPRRRRASGAGARP